MTQSNSPHASRPTLHPSGHRWQAWGRTLTPDTDTQVLSLRHWNRYPNATAWTRGRALHLRTEGACGSTGQQRKLVQRCWQERELVRRVSGHVTCGLHSVAGSGTLRSQLHPSLWVPGGHTCLLASIHPTSVCLSKLGGCLFCARHYSLGEQSPTSPMSAPSVPSWMPQAGTRPLKAKYRQHSALPPVQTPSAEKNQSNNLQNIYPAPMLWRSGIMGLHKSPLCLGKRVWISISFTQD